MNTKQVILFITVLMISINCEEDNLNFLSNNSTEVHSNCTHTDEKENELLQRLEESRIEYERHLDNFVIYKNDESAAHNFEPRNLVQKCSNCWQIPKAGLCGCARHSDCCSGRCFSRRCFDA